MKTWLPVLYTACYLALLNTPLQAADSGVILLYHHVATGTPASTSISPDDFKAHLEYLRDNGFNVIALNSMVESLLNGNELPDKAVAITFDDGYSSIYETAFPLLESFNFPFTLFLSTGPINQGLAGYMSWEHVEEMANAGVIIANHMVDHPYMLQSNANESRAERLTRLRTELLRAETDIESRTGQSHRYLAYPYGEYDLDIKQILDELGYIGLAQNSGAVGRQSDFLALPRFPLAGIYANLETARVKFSSLPFNVEQLDPLSPVTQSNSPATSIKFNQGRYNLNQISCFAEGEPLEIVWTNREDGILQLNPERSFNSRRWRYICTAPEPGSGRFYWYSVQWINPDR